MSFFRNVAGLLATSTVNMPLALLTGVVLARWLTPTDRGLYAVALAFAGIGAILFKVGMPSASVYRLRRFRSAPDQVISVAFIVMTTISAVVLVGGWFGREWMSRTLLSGAPQAVVVLGLAMIPVHLFRAIFASTARGMDRFRIPNINGILTNACLLIGQSIVLIGWNGGLLEAFGTLLVVQIGFTLYLGAQVLRLTGFSFQPNLRETADSLRFGLKSYAQALAGQVHERIDIFMLAYFLADPSQVAYYAVAAGVTQRLKMVPDAISSAAFPQLAGYGDSRAAEFACRITRQATGWTVVMAVTLGAVAPLLLPFMYGEAYKASLLPFLVLLPGMALLTVYRVLSRYFMAIDRHQANIYTQAISVVVNIGLNAWLIPIHGVVGAAIASLASYSLEAVLITYLFVKVSGKRLSELFVLRHSDIQEYTRRIGPALRRIGIAR